MKTIALASAVALLCGNPAAAALTRIGAAGGVGGKVLALASEPGAVGRIMSSGQTVYHKDKVSTDAKGRMQVLLLDETVFTIGPNSELILDEFVYDPFTETGKVTAQVTKGVFRFVSGKVARKRPSDVNIKLPTGTIGIRGTILGGKVEGNTAIVALLGPGGQNDANERPGSIAVQNAGVTVDITRPGYATRIDGPGIPPTPPFQLTPAQLTEINAAPEAEAPKEESSSGGEGGAPAAQDTESASEASGETTSSAQGDLTTTESTGGLAETFNEATTVASQTAGIADGPSTWDQLRNSVITGTGFWDTSGGSLPASCSGSCGGSVTWSMWLYADFGAKTFTSGGANISGGPVASTSISGPIPFPGSGPAVFDFVQMGGSNSFWTGSQIAFQNANGQAGGAADLVLQYSDGSSTVTGSHTSPWVPY